MAAAVPAGGDAAAAAAEEVAGLDRVLTRLALTDDDKLEKVLQKLIPVVVGQLKSPHPATFNKVREILSHVNKRLKGLPTIQLPLVELAAMYRGDPPAGTTPAQYGMVRNFSLVYAEMAAERASSPDRLAVLPLLLPGLSRRPVDHQNIILRIAAAALELQPPPPVGGTAIPGLNLPSATAPVSSGGAAGPGGASEADASASGSTPAADGEAEAAPVVSAAEAALRAKYPYLADKTDRELFLSYGLKLMLYAPRTVRAPTTPLAAGQAAVAGAAAGAAAGAGGAPAAPLPPGLSAADVKQLEAKGVPTPDQVVKRKLGLLNLLAAAGIGGPLLPVGAVLPHLLTGSVDPAEAVSRRAEELLKRSAALDPSRPAANLEDPELIRQLLRMFHGSAVQLFYDGGSNGGGVAAPQPPAADQVASPVGPALRSRLATVFCRSIIFANTFPASLLTIQECVLPPQATVVAAAAGAGGGGGGTVTGIFARLRQQGLELCVWVFKHAARHQLKAMGPVVLQGLLDTLDGTAPATPGGPIDSSTITLRGFAYQAIGSLAQRVPELLQPRIDIARRFFTALSDEPPGVRAAVQEATGALSRAFVVQPSGAGAASVQKEVTSSSSSRYRAELDELLLESIRSHKDAVRLCAVQWACRLFPFQHVPARWVCVLAAGDNKHDVREEAARGLKPPASTTATKAGPSAATTAAAAAPDAAAGSSEAPASASATATAAAPVTAAASTSAPADTRLPSLYALLRYVRQKLPRLRHSADALAPLPLAPRSYLALIALMRLCRHVTAGAEADADGADGGAVATAAAASGGHDAMEVDAGDVTAGADEGRMETEGPGGAAEAVPGSRAGVEADPGLPPNDGMALLSAYACALESGLCRVEGSSEVTAQALEALLEAAAEDSRGALAARYAPRAAWLRSFLAHIDPGARVAAAKLLGSHVAAAMEPAAATELLTGMCSQLAPLVGRGGAATAAGAGSAGSGGTGGTGAAAPAAAGGAASAASTGTGAVKQEEAEGCLLTIGLMVHAAAVGQPSLEPSAVAAAVDTLAGVLNGGGAAILRATAALALSYACAAGIQPGLLAAAPSADAAASTAAASTPAATAMQIDNKPEGAKSEAAGGSGEPKAAGPEGAAAAAAPAAPAAPARILDLAIGSIVDLLSDKDAKVASRAATAAGFLAGGWGGAWVPDAAAASASDTAAAGTEAGPHQPTPKPMNERLLDGLFATAANKSEDLQFAVGEALAWAFGGLSVSPDSVLRDNFTTLADRLTAAGAAGAAGADAEMEDAAAEVPEALEVEALEGQAAEAAAALRGRVLSKLLDELVISPKAEVRCAGSVWLVSLLGFCGRAAALRGSALPRIQEALSGLLGDSNELTQEMASRGVSLVYRLGDAAVREQLVGSLVAVLQGAAGGGGGAGRPVKLTADTQVFEEGALGSAPGGASGGASGSGSGAGGGGGLSTYKELCALATDLGQPDLIYKFMDLAHHAAALNSRRGAAFGFAGIARLAARGGGTPGAALAKHLAALVPKLYRYTHDPNPKVAEAMVAIWRSLVDDPRATLDKHFAAIMTDLLREMGGRLWRNRQAACSAMSDLLQGRRWPELAPFFSQIWMMTFRAMDDIKDSVRRAALSLARTVRGLTLRLADPAHTPTRECSAAVAAVMPILLEHGLLSNVVEVRALAVEVLGLVAKTAPPPALRPLLPALVPALLEALSSLEDVRLNYVEQHAERLGLDSERLEGARVAAARSSPLGDTLDLAARLADGPCLEQLIPALVGTVKRGVGLNTKVGTARFIRNLASRPGALTPAAAAAAATAAGPEPGGSGATAGSASEPLLRPHAGPLLRVLVGAVKGERSGTVRRAYAAAAAQVVRHAGEKRLDKFVAEALASYADPGADTDSRLSGGLLLRELLRAAPEKLRSYDTSVLPACFGAKMDEDKDVAAIWAEVWEEGVSSEPAALRLYGNEICTTLCEMLGGQQWGRKKAAAEATVKLTEIAPDALGEHGRRLAAALLAELGVGRLWEGKETVLRALAALVAADPKVTEETPGHAAVVDALMAAVGRKKSSYRTAALAALEVVLKALPGSHYERVAPVLLAAVARHCEAGATSAQDAGAAAGAPSSSATAAGAAGVADDESERPLPLSECLACLSAAFARVGGDAATASAAAAVVEQGGGFAAALRGVLLAQLPWQPKLAAAQGAQVLAQRCANAGVAPSAAADLLGPLAPGLLQSALDHKIQQLRLTALSALTAIAQAAAGDGGAGAVAALTAQAASPTIAAVPAAAAAAAAAPAAGWSETDRRALLPGLVSGLQQLAEADKAAAVIAAALGVKAALEPLLRVLPASNPTTGNSAPEETRAGASTQPEAAMDTSS